MDDYAADGLGLLESHEPPGDGAVGALGVAGARLDRVARIGLPRADPDLLRVRRRDGDRASRSDRVGVKNRAESHAAVRRFPDATGRGADKKGFRWEADAGDVGGAALEVG